MKSFLLSSFLLIFISCASYTKDFQSKDKTIDRFTPGYLKGFEENSFKISIEAYGNHFGGILVVKKLNINHYRLAFLNEFGGKMLDFEIKDKKLELNYALEQLNRKILLNFLEKDFVSLFSEENLIEKEFVYNEKLIHQTSKLVGNKYLFYEFNSAGNLNKITLAKRKEKLRINLIHTATSFPDVEISHGEIPIKIYLHLLGND